jgi:hypothetical protein
MVYAMKSNGGILKLLNETKASNGGILESLIVKSLNGTMASNGEIMESLNSQ